MAAASTPIVSPRDRGGSTSQAAVRILILLDVLGSAISDTELPNARKVLSSLTLLEKLDFWLRNPDYLADDLMTEFESGRLSRATVGAEIARMIDTQAPSLHRYPMARYLYGAYERLDDPLSLLKAHGQIAHRRTSNTDKRSRRDYFLLEAGQHALIRLRQDIPELQWYDRQAAAISLLASAAVGAQAKRAQYLHPEYRATPNGAIIPSILDRVSQRARALQMMTDPNAQTKASTNA